jgi:hypothetical protein
MEIARYLNERRRWSVSAKITSSFVIMQLTIRELDMSLRMCYRSETDSLRRGVLAILATRDAVTR